MHVVLPTATMIQVFTDTANHLAGSLNYPMITPIDSSQVIFTMVEEAVFNRLHWTQKRNDVEKVLQRVVPFWTTNPLHHDGKTLHASLRLYRVAVERPEMEIENYLDPIMGEPGTDAMWIVWHTLKIGNDLVLERGTDFRLIEMERRGKLRR